MIVMFASSNFQFWYLNLLSNEGLAVFGGVDEALDSLYRLRMIGANGFASYSAGFAQAIALFLGTAATQSSLSFAWFDMPKWLHK